MRFQPYHHVDSQLLTVTLRPSMVVAGVIIMRAAWLWLRRPKMPGPPRLYWTLAAFLIWCIALIPWALNPGRALIVMLFTIFTCLTAAAMAQIFKRVHLPMIGRALLLSTLIVCLFGLYQYFGNLAGLPNQLTGLRDRYSWQVFGFPRIQSTTLEPLYFALFLLFPSALLMALYIGGVVRRLALGSFFLTGLCLLLTVSRGGTAAFIVLVITMGILAAKAGFRAWGRLVLVALASAGATLALISWLGKPISIHVGPQPTGRPLSNYTAQIQTTGLAGGGDERTHSRVQAWELFLANPIVGVGPGNFGPHIQHNQQPEAGWSIVNNEPLELLSETGVIGFGLFGTFAVMLFVYTVKAWRTATGLARVWLMGLLGWLVALAFQYQTFSTLYLMQLWVPVGLLLGLLQWQPGPKRHGRRA